MAAGEVVAIARLATHTAAIMLFVLVGCGYDAPQDSRVNRSGPFLINEKTGELGGVPLGGDPRDIERAFGTDLQDADPGRVAVPTGQEFGDIGGPGIVGRPVECTNGPYPIPGNGRRRRVSGFLGVGVGFELCGGKIYFAMVTTEGARTVTGIHIGGPLNRAKHVHGLRCGESGDSHRPANYFPYCAGEIAPGRWVWFGRDPIRSIAIATVPLAGSSEPPGAPVR